MWNEIDRSRHVGTTVNEQLQSVACSKCGDDGVDIPTSGRHYQAKVEEACWAQCGGKYILSHVYWKARAEKAEDELSRLKTAVGVINKTK